jgi:hypothetical protein
MEDDALRDLLNRLTAMLVKQDTINDKLTAMLEKHENRLDNHEEQINRLIRIEEKLEAFIERSFKSEENGR